MKYPINYKEFAPSLEFYSEVIVVYQEAENYLNGFAWCDRIVNSNLYLNLGSTLCIFLFEIENAASKDDSFLWVIAGDLPPMYLDIYGAKTTKQVIEDYVGLANDWINHIKAGKSVEECYPFNAEPTIEMANLLEARVIFMSQTLINNVEDVALALN